MVKPSSTPAKTQKSISSFFTPKSSQKPQDSSSPPATKAPGNLYDAANNERTDEAEKTTGNRLKRVLEEDGTGGNTKAKERPSKRAKSVEVEEEDDESYALPAADTRKTSSSLTRGKSKSSLRTNKYMFSGSSQGATERSIEEEPEDESEKARKVELHKKFVKKLGHPDSLKRIIHEDDAALEVGDEEGEEEEEAPVSVPVKNKKKGAKTGKLTPMELQVLDIKRKHMDTLLIVEVGYKFKFFGEDARTAAKVLSIVCIPGKFRFDERKLFVLEST